MRGLRISAMKTISNDCLACGTCCKLFLINLNEEEYRSRRYKSSFIEDFEEAELCGANIIDQKDDDSCFYLKSGKCSIYETRPSSCRNFSCKSENPNFASMIEKIKQERKLNKAALR